MDLAFAGDVERHLEQGALAGHSFIPYIWAEKNSKKIIFRLLMSAFYGIVCGIETGRV